MVLCMATTAAAPTGAGQRTTANDVHEWLELLQQHRVGILDAAAMDISRWDWKRLSPVLREVHQHAHPAVILRSAALLSDIAFAIPSRERQLSNLAGGTLMANDGRLVGAGTRDGHLAAARTLLDALPRSGSLDAAPIRAHVIAWYRAVGATLADVHNLADLEPHVQRATARFPDHPGVLFDAGCFYETFASPRAQVPLAEADRPEPDPPGHVVLKVERSEATMLAEAEKYFRQAATADPSFAEAAVRLGRVLALRGRAAAALETLRRAAGLGADAAARYYSWMFYGAALADADRPGEALQAFQAAAALFPEAQSPQLAISQVAADYGDRMRARAALERVFAPALDARREDPWWDYLHGSGRNAVAIRRAFVERMQALDLPEVDAWRVR
jgi:tetratricopeptide (TPR) repeat protein